MQQARLAASDLLDRGLGRPAQSVDATVRRGADVGVTAGNPDQARQRIEALILAASATGAAGIAASADLPAMTGSSDQASDRQSVGAGEGSPSENDNTDDAERALQMRYDASGRGEE